MQGLLYSSVAAAYAWTSSVVNAKASPTSIASHRSKVPRPMTTVDSKSHVFPYTLESELVSASGK